MNARILIVEDEYLIAQDITEALETAGLTVVGRYAKSAEALDFLAAPDPCDAAVLDASLRGGSSLPVCEALLERGIPFLILTGFGPDQLPDAMKAMPVLTKPLDPRQLTDAVQALLAGL